MMLQERREAVSSTTSSVSSDISVIHQKNKMDLLQNYFDEAKKFVGRALKSDERNDRMSALELYNKALNNVQSGLSIIHSSQQVSSALKEMKQKMEKLKVQVKSRMEVLLKEEESNKLQVKGTDARTAQSHSHTTTTTTTVGSPSSIGTRITEGRGGGGNKTIGAEADVIFSSSTGCKVVRVNESGCVLKCTSAEAMHIFKYREHIPGQPPAFLQCGDFVYPLVPGQSPVLNSSRMAYVFPDIESDGQSVGIMFNGLPKHELRELNETFLALSNFKVSGEVSVPKETSVSGGPPTLEDTTGDDTPTWGSSISGKLDAGVTWVSDVISTGTSKAGELLNKGGDKVRDNIEPRDEPVEIPQPVEKGAYYARKVSGAVVGVSDFLMITLAKGTVAVGKKIGTVVAESDMVKGREINPHAKEVWKVTKSSAKGAGRVFSDLEQAAKSIIRGAGTETSKTVGHKYGDQAGRISDDGLTTAGNAVNLASTYWSWKTWGISFLGKVGKVLASQDEKQNEESSLTQQQQPDTVQTCDSVSSTVKSHSYSPSVSKSQPQHKLKKEVLYS